MAAVARAIWSQTLAPGKTKLERVGCDIKITLAALDEQLASQDRCSVKVIQHDEADDDTTVFVLTNLVPGKIETQMLDLIINEDEDIEIELTGKNTVHLSGNYIIQQDPYGQDGSEDALSEDEEAYALDDVSSDAEIDPADLLEEDDDDVAEGRFEEIEEDQLEEEKPAPKKAAPATAAPSNKRPAEASSENASKKQKKNKDKSGNQQQQQQQANGAPPNKSEKVASKPNAGANQQQQNGPKPGQQQQQQGGGEGKKHKKNKNKDKKKD